MRIGDLARATGASPRSLRYYEEQGLISSTRTPGGQRLYGQDAVARVDLIRSLFAAGLNSTTIDELLPCITEPSVRTPVLEARLREELARVDDQISALRTTRSILADLTLRYRIPCGGA